MLSALLLAATAVHAVDKFADTPNPKEREMKATAGQDILLFPMPQKMTLTEGVLRLQAGRFILLQHGAPQLQLYTEHTFAYRNHKDVWENASPMTADEIRKLDAYCGDRFIELVPNQNSFGHMGRWLGIKRYSALAEDPGNPDTLCPTDPNAIKLLDEMYAELLPNFSSRQFNVGCDETDVGNGPACLSAGYSPHQGGGRWRHEEPARGDQEGACGRHEEDRCRLQTPLAGPQPGGRLVGQCRWYGKPAPGV